MLGTNLTYLNKRTIPYTLYISVITCTKNNNNIIKRRSTVTVIIILQLTGSFLIMFKLIY